MLDAAHATCPWDHLQKEARGHPHPQRGRMTATITSHTLCHDSEGEQTAQIYFCLTVLEWLMCDFKTSPLCWIQLSGFMEGGAGIHVGTQRASQRALSSPRLFSTSFVDQRGSSFPSCFRSLQRWWAERNVKMFTEGTYFPGCLLCVPPHLYQIFASFICFAKDMLDISRADNY